jgi:soluble lytic murein transglycosylase-like protein
MQQTQLTSQIASSASRPAVGRMRSQWARVPSVMRLLLKVHVALLAMLLLVASAVSVNAVDRGYERFAFALPAVERASMPWDTEVNAFGHKVSQAFGVGRRTAAEFAPWILEASRRQRIEPELIASLVLTESSFRKDARSHVGAIGPAQVRPEYWSGFCGSDLQDPAENIYCGAQVLSHLLDRCGDDTDCALQAYNVGLHSTKEQAGRRYVTKIDRYRDHLRNYPL